MPRTAEQQAQHNADAATLDAFIGRSQRLALLEGARGEEREYFRELICGLILKLDAMPKVYEQDGAGDDAVVHLHYFNGGSDWWILERDTSTEQHQAFGFVCLNGMADCAELGYLSIAELIRLGVELDLHWTPCRMSEIRKRLGLRPLAA